MPKYISIPEPAPNTIIDGYCEMLFDIAQLCELPVKGEFNGTKFKCLPTDKSSKENAERWNTAHIRRTKSFA
jgi:hypothetical protein